MPFDRVGDLFAGGDKGADEPPTPPAGLSDDELGELSGLVATLRLPEAMRLLDEDLVACFSPVAEHVSAGFQLHSCTSLDAPPPDSLTASCPADAPDALPAYDLTQHSVAPTPPTPTAAGRYTDGTADGGSALAKASQQTVLMLASPQQAGSPLAARGVQLALYRARWTLQDRVSPSWEVCALGGCEVRFAGDAPRTFSADDAPRAQGQPACLRSSSRLPRLPRDVAPPPSRPSTVRPRRRSSCPPPTAWTDPSRACCLLPERPSRPSAPRGRGRHHPRPPRLLRLRLRAARRRRRAGGPSTGWWRPSGLAARSPHADARQW